MIYAVQVGKNENETGRGEGVREAPRRLALAGRIALFIPQLSCSLVDLSCQV